MHIQPSREDLIELTKLNPFDRFPDGRPCVPDDYLERMKLVTTEEAWGVLRNHGYDRQFEGNWMETHPGTITVGRAVTAQFLPHRPDYHDAVQQAGVGEGRGKVGGQNSWVIESLQLNDVMVVDIFGKVKDGTVVGDNLGTATRSRTRVGAVIDGGIRDYQGLVQLTDVNFYMRGVDPTAIADVTLARHQYSHPHRRRDRVARRCDVGHTNRHHFHPAASCSGSCRNERSHPRAR